MAQTQKYRSRERERDRERSSGYRRDTSPHKRKRRQEESHESNYHDSHHHHHHHHKEDKHHNKRSRRSNSTEREETPPWDDEERHYKIRIGEDLTPRYKIMTLMGEGTFGRVVECWDRQTKKSVAVKIVRAIEKYRDAAKLEIEVLDTLKENDPNCTQPLIQMHNWFSFRGHTCMVFPKHGLSLYDFMSKNDFRPFSVSIVQEMGFQLLHSVAYLHSLTLIHTDLKPENILLETSDYEVIDNPPRSYNSVSEFSQRPMRVPLSNRIKLIDFGSATFSHRYHTTIVSTRHYRAPEIMMGMGWSYACDIWSIACIMLQLYTGDTLFQTRENREHLAMMEKVFGVFPEYFVDLADRHTRKYFRHGSVVFPSDDVTTSDERAKQLSYVKHMRRLQDYVAPADDLFLALLLRLFEYDPAKRISAAEALKHPFFDGVRDMYQYRDSRDKENNRERVRERDRESRDRRDSRESRESRESRDKTRDYRDNRDNREYKDNRDYREYRDYNKDYREYGDRDCVPERRERERDYRDHEREYREDYREREYREGRVYRERDYREYRDDRDRDREYRRYEYRDRYDYRVR